MKWAPQQIIRKKKHFCDVKIWLFPVQRLSTLQQLELSSTQYSQLKLGLTPDTGRANKLSSDFLFFKFWFHMKWTNHKLRFEIYRRHMHKSFELCCVLSCFADYSSTRPLTACRVSSTTGARPTWGRFFSMFFLYFFGVQFRISILFCASANKKKSERENILHVPWAQQLAWLQQGAPPWQA